jgi:hypothetical protein
MSSRSCQSRIELLAVLCDWPDTILTSSKSKEEFSPGAFKDYAQATWRLTTNYGLLL